MSTSFQRRPKISPTRQPVSISSRIAAMAYGLSEWVRSAAARTPLVLHVPPPNAERQGHARIGFCTREGEIAWTVK